MTYRFIATAYSAAAWIVEERLREEHNRRQNCSDITALSSDSRPESKTFMLRKAREIINYKANHFSSVTFYFKWGK